MLVCKSASTARRRELAFVGSLGAIEPFEIDLSLAVVSASIAIEDPRQFAAVRPAAASAPHTLQKHVRRQHTKTHTRHASEEIERADTNSVRTAIR